MIFAEILVPLHFFRFVQATSSFFGHSSGVYSKTTAACGTPRIAAGTSSGRSARRTYSHQVKKSVSCQNGREQEQPSMRMFMRDEWSSAAQCESSWATDASRRGSAQPLTWG